MPLPYSKREQRGWYMYDWANSTFATTVVTLFLGPYLTALAKAGAGADGYIHPLGIPVDPRSWWSYLVSLSVLTQVVVLPILGDGGGLQPAQAAADGRFRVHRRACDDRDVPPHGRSLAGWRRAVSDCEPRRSGLPS